MKWYLPTFYGDIRLESQGRERTMLTLHGLTPEEEMAMQLLMKRAEGGALKKRWATAEVLSAINLRNTVSEQKLVLEAPISEVHKVLAKALKPHRKQLSVVRFSGGKIEEITNSHIGLIEVASEKEALPAKPEKPTVAATVAAPVRGCPAPDFTRADVLATEVLRSFLSTEQLMDFEQYQSFVAVGADTGHRYQLTSRHARDVLKHRVRTLYDLDQGSPLCVHDWDVPAAEELLAIFLCLSCPGRESYLRVLPTDDHGVMPVWFPPG